MDLIDRDRLNAEMYHECFEKDGYFSKGMQKWDSGNWIRYKVFEEVLKKQPSARPKGKWIDITKCGGASLWKCSECGELFLEDFYYCPNCGADMREVE